MKAMTKVNHTTFRNGKLFCLNCGGEFDLPIPIPIGELTAKVEAFNQLHKDCEKAWKQPIVDQTESINKRMLFWLEHGERGISSEVMFQKFSQQNLGQRHPIPPRDTDDFHRCHLLLETIPEWKSDLHKLKELSPIWSKLVDNWDKLTEMLIEQLETEKENGMYELMKKLGC